MPQIGAAWLYIGPILVCLVASAVGNTVGCSIGRTENPCIGLFGAARPGFKCNVGAFVLAVESIPVASYLRAEMLYIEKSPDARQAFYDKGFFFLGYRAVLRYEPGQPYFKVGIQLVDVPRGRAPAVVPPPGLCSRIRLRLPTNLHSHR